MALESITFCCFLFSNLGLFWLIRSLVDLTQEIEVINSDSSDEENDEAVPADDPLTNLGLLLQTLMNRRNANANGTANGSENNQNNANHGNNNNSNNSRMNQEPEVIDLRDSSEEEPDEGDVTSELLLV